MLIVQKSLLVLLTVLYVYEYQELFDPAKALGGGYSYLSLSGLFTVVLYHLTAYFNNPKGTYRLSHTPEGCFP